MVLPLMLTAEIPVGSNKSTLTFSGLFEWYNDVLVNAWKMIYYMGLPSSTTTRKKLWNSCGFNLFFADKPFKWSFDHLWATLNTWLCLEFMLLILAAIDSSDWLLNALKDTDEYPVVFTLETFSFLSLKLVSSVSSSSIWPWESWFDCRLWFQLAAASSIMSTYGSNFCLQKCQHMAQISVYFC